MTATGRHHRPPLWRRALRRGHLAILWLLAVIADWWLRRRIEAAKDDAYAATLHEINVDRYIPAPLPAPPVVAAGPPPAAVLPDQGRSAYNDDTQAFGRSILEAGL